MKQWNAPMVEELDLDQTMNNIVVGPDSDGLFAGDLGPGSPDGFMCQVQCS